MPRLRSRSLPPPQSPLVPVRTAPSSGVDAQPLLRAGAAAAGQRWAGWHWTSDEPELAVRIPRTLVLRYSRPQQWFECSEGMGITQRAVSESGEEIISAFRDVSLGSIKTSFRKCQVSMRNRPADAKTGQFSARTPIEGAGRVESPLGVLGVYPRRLPSLRRASPAWG